MNNNQLLHNITMLQRFKADSDLWKQECNINNQSAQNFFSDENNGLTLNHTTIRKMLEPNRLKLLTFILLLTKRSNCHVY